MTAKNRKAGPGKFHIQGQTIIFSSGRRLRAERGVLGISQRLEVFQGHSGVLVPSEPFLDDSDALTNQERIELADYMLERWQAFKDLSSGPDGPGNRIIYSPAATIFDFAKRSWRIYFNAS